MYIPNISKIIYSRDVVFGEIFSSVLEYTSHPYVQVMAMSPAVSYIPCATSLRGETCNTITFSHFEEGGLLSETHENVEISDEYDDNSIMPPLISEEEMDVMD